MGIKTGTAEQYGGSVRGLFPQGDYWDRLFADPESDLNLFCKAKTREIMRLRKRMGDLLAESNYETSVETIENWERVLLGYTNPLLPLEERRAVLRAKHNHVINKTVIGAIARKHGLSLADIVFPFKPSFFGFSQFGRSFFSRPAFFSVFYIICSFQDTALVNEAKKRIEGERNRSSFGRAFFGRARFLSRSYFIKDYAGRIFSGMERLQAFEREVCGKLLSSNVAYFLYKF